MTTTDPTFDDMTLEEAGWVFLDSDAHVEPARFHAGAAKLRAEDPIHWVEHERVNPFWVVTRHADVMAIEQRNDIFLNEPRAILGDKAADARREQEGHLVKSLVQMDDPEHKHHREMTAAWFRPRNLAKLDDRLSELSIRSVDKMIELGGECDFATDIAMQYPLNVILAILGLPESDYPRMLQLTQELFGPEDPEFSRGDDNLDSLMQTVAEFVAYFNGITEDRRADPTEDLASVIANGIVNGEPIGPMEQIGYYIIVATAGHDTTSNAMSGGMEALIQHPDQLARLKADPSLLDTAVDEMIRWTTPVKHFMRTATEDFELSGTTIRAGDDVYLAYWSANRDEQVFDDPFAFDVGRDPNRHLAFGFGVHYCLGALLAKKELKSLFGELVPRLDHAELAGEPQLTRSTFVSGHKHLPIRYSIA